MIAMLHKASEEPRTRGRASQPLHAEPEVVIAAVEAKSETRLASTNDAIEAFGKRHGLDEKAT